MARIVKGRKFKYKIYDAHPRENNTHCPKAQFIKNLLYANSHSYWQRQISRPIPENDKYWMKILSHKTFLSTVYSNEQAKKFSSRYLLFFYLQNIKNIDKKILKHVPCGVD